MISESEYPLLMSSANKSGYLDTSSKPVGTLGGEGGGGGGKNNTTNEYNNY